MSDSDRLFGGCVDASFVQIIYNIIPTYGIVYAGGMPLSRDFVAMWRSLVRERPFRSRRG